MNHLSFDDVIIMGLVFWVANSTSALNPANGRKGPTTIWVNVVFIFGVIPFVLWCASVHVHCICVRACVRACVRVRACMYQRERDTHRES